NPARFLVRLGAEGISGSTKYECAGRNGPERKPRLEGGAFRSLVPYTRGGRGRRRRACPRRVVVQKGVSGRILQAVGAGRRTSSVVVHPAVPHAGRRSAVHSRIGGTRGGPARAGCAT